MARRKQTKDLIIENFEGIKIPIFYVKVAPEDNASGWCTDPTDKNPYIIVDPDLLTRRKLNVLIEEVFHAYFFDLPERKARKFAANLGKAIYSEFLKQQ